MNEQTEHWAGTPGDEYHARNRVDWRRRINFWNARMEETAARTVFEAGCGPGWNLSAIQSSAPFSFVKTYGCEPNLRAKTQAMRAGHEVFCTSLLSLMNPNSGPEFDLAFTCGMLIHVAPVDLEATMRAICLVSAQYVLSIEYHAEKEEMVEYRGQQDRLWRRPYGRLYHDLGLKPVLHGTVGALDGFDPNGCTWDLLSK